MKKQNYKVRAASLLSELLRICDERAMSFYELANLAHIDKGTLYRMNEQEDVQIRTVKNLANALKCSYKIDKDRNVTFVTAADAGNSYQESHLTGLKQQLTEILNNLNEDSLENLLEILISMKEQGKFNHADTTKNYEPSQR